MGRASESMMTPDLKPSILVGTGASCLLLGPSGFSWCFSFAPDFQ